MPSVRTIPAMPGSVSVAPMADIRPVSSTRLNASATVASTPKNL